MHTTFPLTFSFLRILRETKSELQLYGTAYDFKIGSQWNDRRKRILFLWKGFIIEPLKWLLARGHR